jgi:hypothetical protein
MGNKPTSPEARIDQSELTRSLTSSLGRGAFLAGNAGYLTNF